MKPFLLAAVLVIARSVAFADPASVLLDRDKVRSMSAEEYAAAIQRAYPRCGLFQRSGRSASLNFELCGRHDTVSTLDKERVSRLHMAAEYGDPVIISALLAAGADVNARDRTDDGSLDQNESPAAASFKGWGLARVPGAVSDNWLRSGLSPRVIFPASTTG